MPKRLAITISGAVSLGSYEAGVLYEVLDAIEQHNQRVGNDDAQRIVIDVLTGASAGGMTAIILAQKLMYSADEFKGPYENPLYNIWVQQISLGGLQATQDDESAEDSIFSSDLIELISKEALTDRYKEDPPKAAVRHSSVGDSLQVGVALTNLNGVEYGYPVIPSGRFTYIDYCDQFCRPVDGPKSDSLDFWEPLRQAAVATGAFPFAFRAQDLQRSKKGADAYDYSSPNIEDWDRDPATFTYSDGGVLQNQPLGMAKNLVDLIEPHAEQENRFYLFVSPHAKDPDANDAFRAANDDYVHLAQRLITIAIGQGGFRDWITARAMNERIVLLDRRAQELSQAILAKKLKIESLASTATALLNLFFPNGQHHPPGAAEPESIPQAQARIATQYRTEIASLAVIPNAQGAFRDAVLAFETAAGLGARDYMTIYGITAADTELAGAGLQAFLGFFDQKFRDHDYDVGRAHARAVLTDQSLAGQNSLMPILYKPSPIHPIDARLDGLRMSQVPAADLQNFKAGMRKRLNQLLKEICGSFLALPAEAVTDPILNMLLDHLIAKA